MEAHLLLITEFPLTNQMESGLFSKRESQFNITSLLQLLLQATLTDLELRLATLSDIVLTQWYFQSSAHRFLELLLFHQQQLQLDLAY